MKKIVWTFGLISGAILAIGMVAVLPFRDQIGFDRGAVLGYTTMVLAFLLVFFGIRSYRDNVGGGRISFGRALAVGSLITLIASSCYVATWEVVYFKFWPDFMEKYQAYAIEHAKASGGNQQEIDAKIAQTKKLAELYKNPLVNVAMTFVEPLPVGLVFVLMSAGILRRRRDGDDAVGSPAPSVI